MLWAREHFSRHDGRTHLANGTDKMIQTHVFHKTFTVSLSDSVNGKEGSTPIEIGGLIWYTEGYKTNESTGAGVYDNGMIQRYIVRLGQYSTAQHFKQMYRLLRLF